MRQARELLEAYLRSVTGGPEPLTSLLADDCVIEFPYAAAMGLPHRVEGLPAIQSHFASVGKVLTGFSLANLDLIAGADPHQAFGTFEAHATVAATGEPYRQLYAARLWSAQGKVTRYSEYWNPLLLPDMTGMAS